MGNLIYDLNQNRATIIINTRRQRHQQLTNSERRAPINYVLVPSFKSVGILCFVKDFPLEEHNKNIIKRAEMMI